MGKLLIICLLISSIGSFAQSGPFQSVVVPAPTKGALSLIDRQEARALLIQVNIEIISDTVDNAEAMALQKQLKDFLKDKNKKLATIKDVPVKYVDTLLGDFGMEVQQFEDMKTRIYRKWGILKEWMKTDKELRIFDGDYNKSFLKEWIKKQ